MPFIRIKETYKIYKEKNVFLWSAFLAYLTVLNVIPFFYTTIFILSKIPFVKEKIPYVKSVLIKIIPAYSSQIAHYIDIFLKNLSGMELLNSVIFSLSIISLILGFMRAIENILSARRKLNIITGLFFFLINLVGVGLIVSIIIALKIVIPYFIPEFADRLYIKLIPFLIWFVMLASLYYIPKPKEIGFFNVILAAFITTINIFLLRIGMSLYFSLFSYNKIYGAVAIVPSVFLWLFLFWNVVLLGAILQKTLKF